MRSANYIDKRVISTFQISSRPQLPERKAEDESLKVECSICKSTFSFEEIEKHENECSEKESEKVIQEMMVSDSMRMNSERESMITS